MVGIGLGIINFCGYFVDLNENRFGVVWVCSNFYGYYCIMVGFDSVWYGCMKKRGFLGYVSCKVGIKRRDFVLYRF